MIKKILLKSTLSSCVIALTTFNIACAADADFKDYSIENFKVVNNQVTPLFKTLFFSQAMRKKIDKQREAYLNPPVLVPEKEIVKITPKLVDGKPKKKRIYIPPKVTISAVIIKPDGSTIIRVNNKYDKSPSKHINVDSRKANTKGVPITVNGQTKVVPVGSTLLTRKNKLIDTYKLNAQTKKSAMPKTEQKAVKQTLKQVQILNSVQKP